jgi:hypothetical protein
MILKVSERGFWPRYGVAGSAALFVATLWVGEPLAESNPDSLAKPVAVESPSSFARLLRSAHEDPSLAGEEEERKAAESVFGGIPHLRDLELRVQNRAWDWVGQSYAIRLEPKGFGEGTAERVTDRLRAERDSLRNRARLNQAILQRYGWAVEWMGLKVGLNHVHQSQALHADRIRVLEAQKLTEGFDLQDLIKAESDLTKLKGEELDLAKQISALERRMEYHGRNQDFHGLDSAEMAGTLQAEEVIARVEGKAFEVDPHHATLDYYRAESKLAQERFYLEKAQNRRFVSFLEFTYDIGDRLDELDRRDEGKAYDLNQAYGLQMGFRIPSLTGGNRDTQRRRLDAAEDKREVALRQRELEEAIRKDFEDFTALAAVYRYLKARTDEFDPRASLRKYLEMAGTDPLQLLAIRESILENQKRMEEARFGLMRNYLKIMDATGELARAPLRNLLSPATERVE